MKGRRIVDGKIEQARLLRQKGFSVREIGRRLRISKSSADRFTQGLPGQSDEPQAAEEPDMSQKITEPEDPEFRCYLKTLVCIRGIIDRAAEMGDYAGVDVGMHGLYQLHVMVTRYFQRKFPQLGPPPIPSDLQEYLSTRQADYGSTFFTPMSPQLAEYVRLKQEANEARIRKFKINHEREMLRLIQGIQEDASRIRDLERKSF